MRAVTRLARRRSPSKTCAWANAKAATMIAALGVLLAAPGHHSTLGAQAQGAPPAVEISRRLAVKIALIEGADARAPRVFPHHGPSNQPLILLPIDADEADLLRGIVALLSGGEAMQPTIPRAATLRTRANVERLWSREEAGRAGRVLQRLRQSQPVVLAGIGRARQVTIYVKKDALRGRLRPFSRQ